MPGTSLLVLNAPPAFRAKLAPLPAGVTITDQAKDPDQIHWFVYSQKQLEKELHKVMRLTQPGTMVWVYYPKGTSKIQTDLTRDKGWDCLLNKSDKLAWVGLISFDETWSVFGFRGKTDADIKKAAKPKVEREIFNWADSETKTIRLPADVMAAFKKHKKEAQAYESLAFSHRREYLEWIITAKRAETRADRIQGTIERLGKGWKNPVNR